MISSSSVKRKTEEDLMDLFKNVNKVIVSKQWTQTRTKWRQPR